MKICVITGGKFYENVDIGVVWRWLFRRDVIIENKILFPPKVRLREDQLFLCLFLTCAKNVCIIEDVLYTYVVRSNGALSREIGDLKNLVRNKIDGVVEREKIREKALQLHDLDIRYQYVGSIVISSLQLMYQLSFLGLGEQIKGVYRYLETEGVEEMLENFDIEGLPLKLKVPIWLIKTRLWPVACVVSWIVVRLGIIKADPTN